MNERRTFLFYFTPQEVFQGLKLLYPHHVGIQAIPEALATLAVPEARGAHARVSYDKVVQAPVAQMGRKEPGAGGGISGV